ncbi:MAG: GNAT family N-acetyltransferase [Cryomorphaceae bacterium]
MIHIDLSDEAQWRSALLDIPCGMYHSWEYCNAIQQTLDDPIRLLLVESGGSVIACTYLERSKEGKTKDLYSPYGFGGFYASGTDVGLERAYESIISFFRRNEVTTLYLMGHPILGNGLSQAVSHRTSFSLDLDLGTDELLAKMRPNYRNEIRRLEEATDHELLFGNESLASSLMDLYYETLDRVGASSSYFFSRETLLELSSRDNCLLIGVSKEDNIMAVLMVLYTPDCAEYFINASDEQGRSYTKLLLWEATKSLIQMKVKTFHLGGGSSEGDHLEAFKRRFGGRKHSIPIWKEVLNQNVYGEICKSFGVAPSDNGYFPAYWKSN